MAELFWAYWDTSLRFGALAILLLAATPVLKRWIAPKWLCWAWAALILRLAVPLALPYSGSIFNLSERLQPSTWTETIRSGVVDAGWGETVIPKFRDQEEYVRSSVIGFSLEEALVLLWLLGMAAMLCGLVANLFRLRRFFRNAARQNSGRLYEVFKDTRKRFGVNANVPLLVSDEVKVPGIAGIFNPRVVLPRSCAESLSDAELRCVLLHELTHYRRGDLFAHHALLLICFVHWYNPLVWLIMRQFKTAMEQACDADVVDSECIETPQEYGFTLLHVMQRARTACASPAGALCLLGNRRHGALRERIQLIASPRVRNPFLAAIGILAFGASLVCAITGEEIVEKEAERLFSLTRLSGPSLLVSSKPNFAARRLDPRDYVLDSAYIETPQSWVQDVDVSKYRGRDIVVRVLYRLDGAGEARDFWLNVKNANGYVIASAPERSGENNALSSKLQEIVMPISLSTTASEIAYGLSVSDAATLWIESVDVSLAE